MADRAVPGLHHAVLDLQHHPHDLVDPVPRPQRAAQHHAAAAGPDPPAARVPAVLRLRRRAGLRAPLHAVHGGADLQHDDAHRPQRCSRRRATPAPRAGRRCGTSSCRCAKPGIAIGSIFVVTIVMGDFVTVRLMSGGQSASVGADDDERDVAAAVSRRRRQRRGAAAAGAADGRRRCCASSTSARSCERAARQTRSRLLAARGLLRACSCCSSTARRSPS